MTFDFDVAIVGGGPAGTSTALHLVRRERVHPSRIVLLEKATHPRDKPCAGAVSAWGLDALAAIGVPLDVPHVPMCGLRVLTRGAAGAYRGSLGVVVRRCEFDASLWRHAAAEGVVVRESEPLVQMRPTAGGFAITTRTLSLTARFVAACDGSGSTVRKVLRIPEPARKGHLYVAETPAGPTDVGPSAGLCDFDLRVADQGIEGYYWDFPTLVGGVPGVSRGIYHANFSPRGDLKARFAEALSARGFDIDSITLKPFSTRPFGPHAQVSLSRLAFVGEAAGIDATTGEGIAQAILTGALAAKHLARSLRTGEASLDGYASALFRSRVGRHLLQSAWLASKVYGPRGRGWRAFLAENVGAREAGARWYSGQPLGSAAKVRLGASLAWSLATGASRSKDAAIIHS